MQDDPFLDCPKCGYDSWIEFGPGVWTCRVCGEALTDEEVRNLRQKAKNQGENHDSHIGGS